MLHVPAPHQEEADVIKRLRGVDISSSSIWKQCKCLASSVGQVGGSSQQRQINMRTTVERGGGSSACIAVNWAILLAVLRSGTSPSLGTPLARLPASSSSINGQVYLSPGDTGGRSRQPRKGSPRRAWSGCWPWHSCRGRCAARRWEWRSHPIRLWH